MSHLIELGYVGFEVSDLGAWERFASTVLGVAVCPASQPGTMLLRMDDHANRFLLVEGARDDIAFAGWRAASGAAFEAFVAGLSSRGVAWFDSTADERALRAVERMVHFQDPDGNRHEVFVGQAAGGQPFVSPNVPGGFVTGDGGLGHIVFGSDNQAAMIAFAQDVLGMKLSDTMHQMFGDKQIDVTFLHLNERHHSFACSSRRGDKALHHFMIEVARIEDVGLAWERHRASGVPVAQDIGQHSNDQMISYYGKTPSGFLVEFGWGGVKVDDSVWEVRSYPRFSDWGHHPALA